MKKLIFSICLLAFSIGMMAQEEKPKSNWIVGEQESSFPGQMIKYAVCQSPTVVKGQKGNITVSLNIMEFRDETAFERIMAAVGKKLKENGLAYNDTSLMAETVIAENEDSLMQEAKKHGQMGYVTAVDYSNRTLWVFFYGNADECNCIMAHIRKDVFTKKVQG